METSELIEAVAGLTARLITRLVSLPEDTPSLARLTDRLEMNLVDALRREGVRAGAIADLFGVAPRTLQARMARHREQAAATAPQRDRSIRQRVLEVLVEADDAGQRTVLGTTLERRCHPDPRRLGPVLAELVDEGLIGRSGAGRRTRFGIFEPERIRLELSDRNLDATEIAVLVALAHAQPPTLDEIAGASGLQRAVVSSALASLEESGRVARSNDPEPCWSRTAGETFRLPIPSSEQGPSTGQWQAIVFDHLAAVISTLDRRLAELHSDDEARPHTPTGCSTYVFEVPVGSDDLGDEVRALLAQTRSTASTLRTRLDAIEDEHAGPFRRVVFYVGQADLGPVESAAPPGSPSQ